MLDEAVRDDADYIFSNEGFGSDIATLGFPSVSDPDPNYEGLTVDYAFGRDGASGSPDETHLQIELRDADLPVWSERIENFDAAAFAENSMDIPALTAGYIVNWNNLSVRLYRDRTQFITDTTYRTISPPAVPAYNTEHVDPTYGTSIYRVTDSGNSISNPDSDPSLSGQSWSTDHRHDYNSRSAWDCSGRYLLINRNGAEVFIDGETYEPRFRRTNPGVVRWCPIRPGVMWYIHAGSKTIGMWDVEADTTFNTHTFGGDIDSLGSESGSAWGPNWNAPELSGQYAMLNCIRNSDGKMVGKLWDWVNHTQLYSDLVALDHVASTATQDDTEGFSLSPLGNYSQLYGKIIGFEDARGHAQRWFDVTNGNTLWTELGYHRPGHADYLIDGSDVEYIVGLDKTTSDQIMRRMSDGATTNLVNTWCSHSSARNLRRIGSYCASIHDLSTGHGGYNEEIIVGRIDNSVVERICSQWRGASENFDNEAHACFSPDGRRIVFASDWGVNGGDIYSFVVELF
ncbi:MAG: hypothetical protein ACR2PS_06010 [Pseudomonadales bacterium]